jgi:YggT family protein
LFRLFELLILGRVLLSWFNLDPQHPVAQFLYQTTEPFLAPIRKVLPPVAMMDLSPIVLIVLVAVVESILFSALR